LAFRVLFDEGVPASLAETFKAGGHDVITFREVLQPSANDDLVCTAALLNDAVLVAFDKDHKRLAAKNGITGDKFGKLSLISLNCPEPMAKSRVEQFMTLLEHEWNYSKGKSSRRMFIVIQKNSVRVHR
jgi:predicted nuclease of predicted toxin-antitoxin system